MKNIKLGFAPTRRSIFSAPDAIKYANLTRQRLRELGVDFVDIDDINEEGLLYQECDRIKIREKFLREGVDGLFLPHANFGTEYECARLAKELGVPVLLWGPRDERPEPDGMRLRDSQCGLFATGKVLRRFNVPFTYMTNCRLEDPEFERGLKDFLAVCNVVKVFRHTMNITPENQNDPNRDRFILSKGHSVEALYAVLAHKGFFPTEEVIAQFNKFGSKYIGHPNNKLPGIEMNSGSLGHGLPVAVGMALAGKMDKRTYRVYTLMGDGELAEGSIWEGFMAGGHYALDNLCAIIDLNGLQISGTTEQVMNHTRIAEQVRGFGWNVIEVDGHDYTALHDAFQKAGAMKGMPTCVLARTIKGYGSAVMENKASWHHHVPTSDEYEQIIADFSARKEAALCE